MAKQRTDLSPYLNLDTIIGRIATLMNNRGMGFWELGRITGIDTTSLQYSFKRGKLSKYENIKKIADVFKVTPEYLQTGKDEKPNLSLVSETHTHYYKKTLEVPIYSGAICGLPALNWEDPIKHIEVDFLKGLDYVFGVEAVGNSMAQTILAGTILFCYRTHKNNIKDGSLVFVSMKSPPDMREGIVKRIKWNKDGSITLYSDNARNFPPNTYEIKDIYEIFAVHEKYIGKFPKVK